MICKLSLNEIFDYKNDFEMKILQVFIARQDIYTANTILQKSDLTNLEFLFVFKIIMGLTREASELLRAIYNEYMSEMSMFSNIQEIKTQYKMFENANNGMDKNSFSYLVMRDIRNQSFHYNDTTNIKNILSKGVSDFAEFHLGETGFEIQYDFSMDIYLKYVMEKWKEYNNKTIEVTDFMKQFSEYSIIIAKNLETIIDGYFEKNTNLLDKNYDGILKRKM